MRGAKLEPSFSGLVPANGSELHVLFDFRSVFFLLHRAAYFAVCSLDPKVHFRRVRPKWRAVLP